MEPVRWSAMCAMPPCGFLGGDPNAAGTLLACDPLALMLTERLTSGQTSPPLRAHTWRSAGASNHG